jgi:hypothetical protein
MLFLEFLTADEFNVDREALDESYRQQHEGDVTQTLYTIP